MATAVKDASDYMRDKVVQDNKQKALWDDACSTSCDCPWFAWWCQWCREAINLVIDTGEIEYTGNF